MSTNAWCRKPMGDIVTISPRISSTRSVGLRMPTSPIRWYSSRVKSRRAAATSTAIRSLLARTTGKSLEGYTAVSVTS